MKPKIKITQNVVERLMQQTEQCSGRLYGTLYKDAQIIIGLYKRDKNDAGDLFFPADVDMCGAFQIGPLAQHEVTDLLADIDVTDNPIFISLPEKILKPYYVINDQLEAADIEILNETALYSDYLHLRIKAQLPIVMEMETNSIKQELLAIRKQFSSGKIGFHLQKEDAFILGSNENSVTGSNIGVNEEMTLGKLVEQNKEMGEEKYSRHNALDLEVLSVVMYKKSTFDRNELESIHAPIIQVEKNETKMLQILLNVDSLSLVHKQTTLGNLYTILVESACRNVRHIGNFIINYIETASDLTKPFEPEVIHYYPICCGHFVTRILNKFDAEDASRGKLHMNFMIPMNRPYFRRSNRFIFKGDSYGQAGGVQLKNVHKDAKPSNNGGEQALVKGDYEYYHYLQDGMDDDGWGCAYRSLQTLASWFKLQGYANKVPTFKEIQKCLFDIGDKPSSFVGSRQWIGSTEVNFVLDSLLGITSKILYCSSGEDLAYKGPELVYHFNTQGTPIMIGGGVLAHTIIGVDYNRDTADIKFLILDPHYTGGEDIKTIVNKGWCGWKGMNFWDKKSYYNMCMPQVPNGI
ncbi:PREDICTED: ufm1-specific protease 2 [Nicrophorus vespilloides]|uniref:Ufm1-specific protease 2 n=1 Tax=Nicrophorus vespilloides TaxID=110193 RepID=A0ABM1MBZ7_NICVS|nr:PREDICTED: ufm1-specific protease 2 [Nicrophorus vespilloides]